jgi:hypothetical protein
MTKVSDVIKGVKARVDAYVTDDTLVFVTDDIPAVVKVGGIYIISPKPQDIVKTMYMSGDYVEFNVRIYGVVHVIDVNSIDNLGDNVLKALEDAEAFLAGCFPLHDRRIGGANISQTDCGSDTWVSSATILTPWILNLHFKSYTE